MAGAVVRPLAAGTRNVRRSGAAGLSLVEREILELAAAGKSYKEIAAARKVSVDTVKNQLIIIRARLGAASTTQAVAIYWEWKARC